MAGKFPIGSILCSPVTIEDLLREVSVLLGNRTRLPRSITYINAHIYNLAAKDRKLRDQINASGISAPDGMSIVWAAKLLGTSLESRCNATESFRAFLQSPHMQPTKALLIGCSDNDLAMATENIHAMTGHCEIIAAVHGYHEIDEYKEILKPFEKCDFVLVGMGSPKSEDLIEKISQWYPELIGWHVGGGTIRILAGTMVEAPVWMRRVGLQWFHRLLCDGSLLSRYLVGNFQFILHVLAARFRRAA